MSTFKFFKLFKRNKHLTSPSLSPDIRVLFKSSEIQQATINLQKIGLDGHHDFQKNWDLNLTIALLVQFPMNVRILDAGSGSRAVFGNASYKLGYKNIFASDLQNYSGTHIKFSKEDITKTNYLDNFFDFVACLSVIEHGIDLDKFLQEMFRITKKGGCLCISTDFWPSEENHSSKFPYGQNNPPMMLFDNLTIANFIKKAEVLGWTVPKFVEVPQFSPRPIKWSRMGAEYTFIWLCFVK